MEVKQKTFLTERAALVCVLVPSGESLHGSGESYDTGADRGTEKGLWATDWDRKCMVHGKSYAHTFLWYQFCFLGYQFYPYRCGLLKQLLRIYTSINVNNQFSSGLFAFIIMYSD